MRVELRQSALVNYAVYDCSNRTRNSPNDENFQRVGFYVVPKVISGQCAKTTELSSKRRALWLSRIRREDLDESATHYRVCGAHFITGERGSSIKCISSALYFTYSTAAYVPFQEDQLIRWTRPIQTGRRASISATSPQRTLKEARATAYL